MKLNRRRLIWVAFAVVLIALALDLLRRHDQTGVDFHTYAAAARVGVEQGWSHLYDQNLVAAAQRMLVPWQRTQPFLSPPTVAWLAATVAWFPYDTSYLIWAFFSFLVFAAALAWAGLSRGLDRWLAVAGALAPWWVMHAVNVGQVVPIVAAATVVAWRLLRDRHEVAAGIVLSLILLKPNTAILVPFALLCAGRFRAFAAWLGAVAVILLVLALTLGPVGLSAYASQLSGRLPTGADDLTLHGAFGLAGASAMLVRLLIVAAVLAAAYRLRGQVGLVVPMAVVAALVISPYLHASDLCLLSAAAWMVWEEKPVVAWRLPLVPGWLLASPFLYLGIGFAPQLQRWPVVELAFLGALVTAAWLPLTGWDALRRRAAA